MPTSRTTTVLTAAVAATAAGLWCAPPAAAQRVTGIDVSDWQGNLSQTTWNNVKSGNNGGKSFVFIRASRGGTVGYYDENDASNLEYGKNTQTQRYDDLYFVQNITRATAAGLYAGPYHFIRPDITTYVDDYGNTQSETGVDEANHFLQQAGPWMKPGYLLPVDDLESGANRSISSLSQWNVDFANTILAAKGIRPIAYVNQSYATSEVDTTVAAAMPNNWVARWPNNTNPSSIDIQNIDPPPTPSTANVYGAWYPQGQPYPTPQPWKFWQYASNNTNVAGISPVDVDVAHGDIEFLKDYLVPALLTTDANVNWTTIRNWNSDADPSGQGPAARLPSVDDTVVLGRAGIVTLSSGNQTIRKLYVSQPLNVTGGALTVGYVPSAARSIDLSAGTISAEISAPVSLGAGTLSAHTIQIDAGGTLTSAGGGTLTFNTLNLAPGAVTPAKLVLSGDLTVSPLNGAMATIGNSAGGGTSGSFDLAGGTRTLTVTDGPANTDLLVAVPITNGSFTKAGAGVLGLTNANTLTGSFVVGQGAVAMFGGLGSLGSVAGFTIHPAGTLTLDNATGGNNNARISAAAPITLAGGALNFIANSTNQSAGNLAATAGASTVAPGGSTASTLAFGAYARSAGATMNFVNAAPSMLKATFSAGVSSGSFIDQGTFVNGDDYAVYDAAGYVRAMTAGTGTGDYATTLTAGRHVKLTSSATAAASSSIRTLNLSGSGLTLAGGAGATLTLSSGGLIKSGGGAGFVAAPLSIPAETEFVVNAAAASDSLTLSGDLTGASALTKSGPGLLVLGSPANAYNGPTTVAQGTLRAAITGAVPATSTVVVGAGATFDLAADATLAGLTVHDGSVTSATLGPTLSLSGATPAVAYNGIATGGTISVDKLDLTTSAGAANFAVADGYALTDLLVSSLLQDGGGGPSGLTKSGAGRLVLAGNNTFTGPLSIAGGVLSIPVIQPSPATPQPLGTSGGNVTLSNNAVLEYAGSAIATMGRGITLGAGGGTIRATAGTLQLPLAIAGNGQPLTFDVAAAVSVAGAIQGAGSLTKNGTGSLTLSSASNSYSGDTILNAGTLNYSGSANLGSSSNSVVFNGGTLRLLASPAGSENRPLIFNAGGGTIDTNGFAVSFTGAMSGSGPLTKVGAGTLTLAGSLPYGGAVTVAGGTLAGSVSASSPVLVTAGGTIGGFGYFDGPVTLTTGGTVNLGVGAHVGSLTVVGPNGGSWNGVGSVAGLTSVPSGTLTIGAGATLAAAGGAQVVGGTLAGAGTLSGVLATGSTATSTGAINLSPAGSIGLLNVTGETEWNGQGSVTGPTTVSGKTLYVNGTMSGASAITLASGTNLKGLGTVAKSITFSGNNRLGGHNRLYTSQGTLTITTPVNWNQPNLFINTGSVSTPGDTLSGQLTIQAAPVVQDVSNSAQFTDPYHGRLVGAGTLTITSTGLLAGQGEVSKPVVLNGGTINFSSAGSLGPVGDIANTLSVSSGTWAGVGTVSGAVSVVGPGALTLNALTSLSAPAGVTVSGGTIGGASSATLAGSLTYASGAPSTFAGKIAGVGNALTINNSSWLTLTGISSYTGPTNINDGVLALTGNNQLATSGISTGMTVVTAGSAGSGHGGSLQLNGNLSYNLPLTIGGAGPAGVSLAPPGNVGALHAAAGSPTWSSNITLAGTGVNGTDPLINQVSAAAGATLTLSGVISSTGSGALAKSGAGDLVLAGNSPNTYPGLTRLYGGRIIVEKDGALGTAANHTFFLSGSATTVAFRSASSLNYATREVLHTDGTATQVDNLAGNNTFAGSIALGGPTVVGAITSDLAVTAGSLTLAGGLYARTGFASSSRTIDKLGPGTLVLTGDSSLAAPTTSSTALTNSTLNVAGGTVDLHSASPSAPNVPGLSAYSISQGATLLNTAGSLANVAVTVDGTYTQSAARLVNSSLLVNPTGTATLLPSAFAASTLSSLTITGTGRLDLTSNDLYVVSPATVIRQYLLNHQIFSSTPDPAGALSLAYYDDGTAVRLHRTLTGDANLDGVVDQDDLALTDRGLSVGGSFWWQGDFNYDGTVDQNDYLLLDAAYAHAHGLSPMFLATRESQFGPGYVSALLTSVPEPALLSSILYPLSSLLLKRRRRPY